ncbi:MAG: hypothetical protein ACR2NP_11160 [Pirellulaceae bacterium]
MKLFHSVLPARIGSLAGSLAILFVVACLAHPVHGDIRWDEGADGDLSNDPLATTPVGFGEGDNEIIGSVADPNDIRDFFTFNIGAGQALTAIYLIEYTDIATGGDGNTGFAHIDDGTQTVIPSAATSGDFLGGTHVDRTIFPNPTDNMLTVMAGAPQGGTGFVAPLFAGDYSFNIQQTGPPLTGYRLNFVVIPEPATGLFMAGLFGAVIIRRRH